MRILFISDNFPPEVNAPASRTYEHAKRWVAASAQVTIITCAPNFPQGRVYAGYRNAWRTVEEIDGIRVVRVKTYITSNEGFVRRTLDYLSFMFSAVFFGMFEKRPDVVVGTSPQFFAACGAWLISVFRWRPFVFELRDLWPASIATVGAMQKGVVYRLLEQLELFLYRRASLIIPVTESFREYLVGRGIDENKIRVIRNGVDLDRYQPQAVSETAKKAMGVGGKFVLAYLGTHGMAHDLDKVLDAAALLQDKKNIVFLFVGDGAARQRLVEKAAGLKLSNVVFHEPVAKDRMPEVWSACDIALVHLKNDPVFATVIPSKIFESFGMGRPVLIVQPRGEAVRIVEGHGAGIWVPPGNAQALAKAVDELSQQPEVLAKTSKAAASAASSHSRDQRAHEMLEQLKSMTARSGPAHARVGKE